MRLYVRIIDEIELLYGLCVCTLRLFTRLSVWFVRLYVKKIHENELLYRVVRLYDKIINELELLYGLSVCT